MGPCLNFMNQRILIILTNQIPYWFLLRFPIDRALLIYPRGEGIASPKPLEPLDGAPSAVSREET